MLTLRSPLLFTASTWAFLTFFGWFILLVVAHSYSQIADPTVFQATGGNTANDALPLNEQQLQLFMYDTLLALACLAACWYADFTRTRASRAAALTVSTFTVFAWMFNLWFVIPAFRTQQDSSNLYCNDTFTSLSRWCHVYRAASAFAVCFEFSMFIAWLWALVYFLTLRRPEIPIPTKATILAPHRSLVSASESGAHDADVSWNTELTEPDDLELMKIAANNPNSHFPIVTRTTVLGHLTSLLTGLSLVGWLILTCALIDIGRIVGLAAWDQTEPNFNRLGDPIVAANWYWLTLSLGTVLAVSSYSSHRRHRGIIGSAMLLSFLSTLQWVSVFVYMARRDAHNASTISTTGNAKHSQYAETAGAGIICLFELLRSLVLVVRYLTYMMVTKADHDRVHVPSHVDAPTVLQAERDNYNPQFANAYAGTNTVNEQQDYRTAHTLHNHPVATEINVPGPSYDNADADLYVPSYNMGIFHGSSIGFRIIFFFQVLTILCWWCLEIVNTSEKGLFDNYQTTGPEDPNTGGNNAFGAPSANDRSYYYNEYMFLLSTALVLGAWLPAFHAEREVSVSSALAAMYTAALMVMGFFLLVWTFSYESIYGYGTLYSEICTNGGNSWCIMTQAAGILALINAFFLLCLFGHSVIRLAERRLAINVYERSVQNVPATIAPLILAAIGIWSFTQLDIGLNTHGVADQMQSQYGWRFSITEAYFASQAFLTFVACAAAVWVGVYASKLLYAWQSWAWRMASLFTSMVAFAFLVPLIIYACRFINNYSLSSAELALTSAIIILLAGTFFYFAAFTFLVHSAFYAAGPAGAALPPTGMTLKGNPQFNQTEQGVAVEKDLETGAVVGAAPYVKNTQYVQTAQPIVNPRTGETVTAVDNYPVASTTTVQQPADVVVPPRPNVEMQPVVQPAVYASEPAEVRYHDY